MAELGGGAAYQAWLEEDGVEEPQRTRREQRGVDRNMRKKKKREIVAALRSAAATGGPLTIGGVEVDKETQLAAAVLFQRDATRRAKEQARRGRLEAIDAVRRLARLQRPPLRVVGDATEGCGRLVELPSSVVIVVPPSLGHVAAWELVATSLAVGRPKTVRAGSNPQTLALWPLQTQPLRRCEWGPSRGRGGCMVSSPALHGMRGVLAHSGKEGRLQQNSAMVPEGVRANQAVATATERTSVE